MGIERALGFQEPGADAQNITASVRDLAENKSRDLSRQPNSLVRLSLL
jgi:hypothetical protein